MANKISANIARQVIWMSVLALHYKGNGKHRGAIISCIQDITSAMNVCSPNTTAATIDLLENMGLLTRVRDERDHRNHLIQPTDRLIYGTWKLVGVAISAADKLFPLRNYRKLVQAGDLMERYFASSLHSLLNVTTLTSKIHGAPLFANSDSGGMLLYKLMSLGNPQHPSDDSRISFPFDEIGHLYGVSRTHIRRLMKKAEAQGFVRLHEEGGRSVEILPPLRDLFENIVAARLARAQFDIHLANEDFHLLPIDRFPPVAIGRPHASAVARSKASTPPQEESEVIGHSGKSCGRQPHGDQAYLHRTAQD